MTDEDLTATVQAGDELAERRPAEGTAALTEPEEAVALADPEGTVADDPVLATADPPRDSRRWVLIGALAGGLGVLLAGIGILGWQVFAQHQLKAASEEAQRAAVSYAQVLTSIDSNKVDENFQQVMDGATGQFKDMYSQSSKELRQLLIENKATATGAVIDSAVQEASRTKATVLLFVDQSVANTKIPDSRIDRMRMKMTLEKVDGRWRASKIELP